MKIGITYISLFALLVIALAGNKAQACSMYKITVDGKTMVGCNEDAWRTTSKIWFENPDGPDEYGAVFTGSRQVPGNRTAPQSGMNEVGLTFSRLVAYHPTQDNPFPDRISITDEVDYLSDILHGCATVEDVKKHIEQYDHSLFYDHVFMYIDSTGKYLIVEPYKLIEGNDAYYVLSNFCPSITSSQQASKLERFRNGADFLQLHEATASLDYCTALSDTMHVCRSRNGDGTLLTSIWDTKAKLVNLYFYHSYDTAVQFVLSEELAKGNHVVNIPELFPPNPEFERLATYKTPSNTVELRIVLVIIAGLLACFSFLFGISLFWKNEPDGVSFRSVMGISAMNLILIAYILVLITNKNIFYFDAPYQHYDSNVLSASSYTPFLLLLTIIPFTFFTMRRFTAVKTGNWIKGLLAANNLMYLMLILGFAYWGLYNVWS